MDSFRPDLVTLQGQVFGHVLEPELFVRPQALRGVWLMEVSELEAMRRSEVAAVKAFLSKTADRYRAAYGRYVNEYPRQCVMFGTTNSSYFLSDITGGRRFWPLRTDEQLRLKDVPKDLPLERDRNASMASLPSKVRMLSENHLPAIMCRMVDL